MLQSIATVLRSHFEMAVSSTRNAQAVLYLVLTLPLLCSVIVPPFGGRDEFLHWFRVNQIASGTLLAKRFSKDQFGGPLDAHAIDIFHWVFDRIQKKQPIPPEETLLTAATWGALPKEYRTISFSPTATYSPLAYVPATVALSVAKLFTSNYIYQLFAVRYFSGVFYIASMLAIVSLAPFGRRFLAVILFSPAILFNSASPSADSINNLIPALLLVLCLRWRSQPSLPLGRRDRQISMWLCGVLALLKPLSILFAAVLLLIPRARFAGRRDHARFLAWCFGICVVVQLAWTLSYPFVPGAYWQTGADPKVVVRSLLADPLGAVGVIWSNISRFYGLWWWDAYASFGGHPYPYSRFTPVEWSSIAFFLCLALALLDGPRRHDPWQAVVLFATGIAYFLLILVAFMVGFAKPGSPDINGIQGRYFYLSIVMLGIALASLLPPRPKLLERWWDITALTITWTLTLLAGLIVATATLFFHKVWPI